MRALEAIQNGESWVYSLELISDIELGEVDENVYEYLE